MPISFVKRLVLGVPVKPSQEDQNWTDCENALNGFASELSASLNSDGTLKNNTVATAAIQDRAVTLAKLDFVSAFWAADTGSANALAISFSPALAGGYVAGMRFWVKVVASNTGASTLNVDANGPIAIKKFTSTGMIDLVSGDMIVGGEYAFIYDGTQFILANPTAAAGIPPSVFASSGPNLQSVADIDLVFFLPTGRTWSSVQMRAINTLDTKATASLTATTTMKWNCGTLLNTPVTLSAATGSGNSAETFTFGSDAISQMNTEFIGVVPPALVSVSPLVLRASVVFTGDTSDTLNKNWSFWAKVSTQ